MLSLYPSEILRLQSSSISKLTESVVTYCKHLNLPLFAPLILLHRQDVSATHAKTNVNHWEFLVERIYFSKFWEKRY